MVLELKGKLCGELFVFVGRSSAFLFRLTGILRYGDKVSTFFVEILATGFYYMVGEGHHMRGREHIPLLWKVIQKE